MGHITTRSELGHNIDGSGHDRTAQVHNDETDTLISADKVLGAFVYNGAGARLGSIDMLMLNKHSGQVAYAVMSFGGFLGIGERYHPISWKRLAYDGRHGGYNIDLTDAELANAPHYARDELAALVPGVLQPTATGN